MKRFMLLVMLVVLLVALFPGVALAKGLSQDPQPVGQFATVETVIFLVMTYLVTAGIKSLSTMLGKDLSGFGAALTAGLVGLVIGIFNSVLAPAIPSAALPVIEPAAGLIVVILGSFGLHKTVKSFQPA